MAVFYEYEYTNKRKNIHPWGWVQQAKGEYARLKKRTFCNILHFWQLITYIRWQIQDGMYQTGTNALQIPDQSIPDKFHLLIVLEAWISMKSLVTFIITIQRSEITGLSNCRKLLSRDQNSINVTICGLSNQKIIIICW